MKRNVSSHDREYKVFCDTKPTLSYDGSIPFEQWKVLAKERLASLLGLPFEKCDPMFEIEYTKQGDGHTEYRFTVQTEPGYFVPCHLFVPADVEGKIPLALCLSGHAMGMHVVMGIAKSEYDEGKLAEWPDRAIAPRALREGYAALVIEARNLGEASVEGYGISCMEAAKIAILDGRTVIGGRVWDAMHILDAVLDNFEQIDPDNIVCTGNSGGGTATYYLACFDERIKIAAPCCAVCSFEASIAAMPHCLCNHIPGIRKYFEMGDIAGLIAPRKLVVGAGRTDPIFPIDGTNDCFATIHRLYEAAGVPENCALVVGDNAHFYYADQVWGKVHQMSKE